ncbi:unnamed protein product, partial [Ectocarpus fasciculatus]
NAIQPVSRHDVAWPQPHATAATLAAAVRPRRSPSITTMTATAIELDRSLTSWKGGTTITTTRVPPPCYCGIRCWFSCCSSSARRREVRVRMLLLPQGWVVLLPLLLWVKCMV